MDDGSNDDEVEVSTTERELDRLIVSAPHLHDPHRRIDWIYGCNLQVTLQ